jgi:hypothetical protein
VGLGSWKCSACFDVRYQRVLSHSDLVEVEIHTIESTNSVRSTNLEKKKKFENTAASWNLTFRFTAPMVSLQSGMKFQDNASSFMHFQ